MASVNLNRSPFLSEAYEYIKENPGCCKRDVILATYGGRPPNRTYAYRNRALDRLIDAGLVKNEGDGSACRYSLVAVEKQD